MPCRIKRLIFLLSFFFVQYKVFSQTPPVYNSADIYMQLKKLNVLGSVLYFAAHPDDENNGLLPYFAKEKLYRTAYLSLTRGDGGQNLIGSEQGIELGLIRTQELLAARRIDGAEQYFSRAYEFGFSKSAEEAMRIWDKEKILSDAVWVIRQYQPDVIITRFPGDVQRAGHGHHAASSLIASEAFIAAADPKKFPEQFKYGVKPWQAKRIVWNTFSFGNVNTTSDNQLKIEIGGYNPLLGKNYGELGGEARSMHKSQGEGRPRRRGSAIDFFTTTGGEPFKNDLMDGIVYDWKRLDGGAAIQPMIDAIIASYKFEQPELSVPSLVKLYQAIKALPEGNWRNKKLDETQQIIEACSGLFSEATTTQETVTQGDTLRVSFSFNKRRPVNATLKNIKLENLDSNFSAVMGVNQNITINKIIPVSSNKKISQPYWLEYPKLEGSFDVRDQLLIGKAENDPSFIANYTVNIEGEDMLIKRAVQYKVVDPAKGEIYQPLPVLPKGELRFDKENYISLNNKPVMVEYENKMNNRMNATVSIKTTVSGKWKIDSSYRDAELQKKIPKTSQLKFIPLSSENNTKELITLHSSDPAVFDGYAKTIAYDHIPTITYFPKATANLVKLDIKVVGKKIGYIVGAGDKVPDALLQLGYTVKFLNEADITDQELKQFDAVITGVRAFNIYEYLTNKNDVLNRYVENGGNLIVQYMKSNNVGLKRIKAGPYSFAISAGARVTEEDAKVNFLLPEHPALNYPNKITDKDFEGWVQERSTYQADQADSHYERLIGMNDTNEKQSDGSLVISKYGKGNFVYLSLVLFRELPAGVPGAYRLMANLIALPKNK